MLSNSCNNEKSIKGEWRARRAAAAVALLCFLLSIQVETALARVDYNWSQRRPNMTVAQNQWGQAGGYRAQNLVYNRNQTFGHQRPQQHATTVRPGGAVNAYRNNQTTPTRNQQNYLGYPVTNQGALNQSRPNWGQPATVPQHPAYGQNSFNRSRIVSPQQPKLPNQPAYPIYAQTFHNNTPPPGVAIDPLYRNPAYNQSQPTWPQPSVPYVPQNPTRSQVSFNQSQSTWPQPSAPQLPNYPYNPALPASNLYPQLPNNPNIKPIPSVPSNSWTPLANQTHLYPQLPNQNLPSGNSNGIPLAPLQPQPQPNPQGPHNWHSGGQSALSYGPGYYSPAAPNTNKNPANPQASRNPYANMFI